MFMGELPILTRPIDMEIGLERAVALTRSIIHAITWAGL